MSPQPEPHPSVAELDVRGAVPPGLTGRLTAVGDGLIHSLRLHGGGVTYLARTLYAAAAVRDLVAVDGSVLAFTDDAAVVELSPTTGTSRRIDLAGRGRSPVTGPRFDPASGELHLVVRGPGDDHAHVVVSAGRFTRRSRRIDRPPTGIEGVVLARDHLVVVADGAIGVLRRAGEGPSTWVPTEMAAPAPLHAHEAGDTVVVLALTPSLERWTLHPDSAAVRREVVAAAPTRFARCGAADGSPGSVWTTGGESIRRVDLVEPSSTHRDLAPNVPGDFVLVPDAARSGADHGWFVGFVHDTTARTTELYVIDMTDLAGPAVAAVTLPRRLPRDVRCTWTPQTQHSPANSSSTTKEHQPWTPTTATTHLRGRPRRSP